MVQGGALRVAAPRSGGETVSPRGKFLTKKALCDAEEVWREALLGFLDGAPRARRASKEGPIAFSGRAFGAVPG